MFPNALSRFTFNTQTRARAWKRLSNLLKNRMRLNDALRLLRQQAQDRNSPQTAIYDHILTTLSSGQTLGAALEGLATGEEIVLINSSQESSRLQEGLILAGKALEARSTIKKTLISALAYPFVLFLLVVYMMIVVANQVMPQLVLISNPEAWNGAPYWLYLQSSFVASWKGVALGCGIVAGVILIFLSFPRWTGRSRRIADKIIPWSIYRLTVGTLWLYAVAIRMRAGQQISTILKSMIAAKSTTPYLREIVQAILANSGKGVDFGHALKNSGMTFPSADLTDALVVYSRMPDFQQHIIELADDWLDDGIRNIQRLAGKLKVTMFVLVIIQLSLVALAIGGLQSQLQGGM